MTSWVPNCAAQLSPGNVCRESNKRSAIMSSSSVTLYSAPVHRVDERAPHASESSRS